MSRRPNRGTPGMLPVPANVDPSLRQYLTQLQESVQVQAGHRGDPLDRAVTHRDIINGTAGSGGTGSGGSGGSGGSSGGGTTPGGGGGTPVVPGDGKPTAIPGKPTGVAAESSIQTVYLTWSAPNPQSYVALTEVYRSAVNDFDTKKLVGVSTGTIYSDPVEPEATYYYWIRFKNSLGFGPWHSSVGVEATTTEPTWDIDGIRIKEATIHDAAIHSLTVDKIIGDTATFVSVNIKDATITSAKLAGTLQSDDYTPGQLGWCLKK